MSIVGQMQGIFLLASGILVSALVAMRAGLFSGSTAIGPRRLPAGRSAWELAFLLGVGFFVDLSISSGYAAIRQMQFAKLHGAGTPMPDSAFTPGDWAFLSTVPPMGAFAALLLGDLLVGGGALVAGLGLGVRRLITGVSAGLVGSLIVLPIVFVVVAFITWLYDRLHYVTPKEHELLKMMHEAQSPAVRVLLIAAAVVVAPLFEEYLFRGHLQTLFCAMLEKIGSRKKPRPESVAPVPVIRADGASTGESENASALPPTLQYPALTVQIIAPTSKWPRWGSIILASLIFAAVHPSWMWPPIFCLSIGLGYAYERTGNLWVSITMHCVFNSTSTFMFLHGSN